VHSQQCSQRGVRSFFAAVDYPRQPVDRRKLVLDRRDRPAARGPDERPAPAGRCPWSCWPRPSRPGPRVPRAPSGWRRGGPCARRPRAPGAQGAGGSLHDKQRGLPGTPGRPQAARDCVLSLRASCKVAANAPFKFGLPAQTPRRGFSAVANESRARARLGSSKSDQLTYMAAPVDMAHVRPEEERPRSTSFVESNRCVPADVQRAQDWMSF
jgi:hypothetical protein